MHVLKKVATRCSKRAIRGAALLFVGIAACGAVAAQAAQLLKRFEGESLQLSNIDLSHVPVLAGPLRWFTVTTGVTFAQIEAWLINRYRELNDRIEALAKKLKSGL